MLTEQVALVSGVSGTLVANNPPQNFATTAEKQNVYLYFTPGAGDNLTLALSSFSTSTNGYASVDVYNPSGTEIASPSCYTSSGGCTVPLSNLSSGTYKVVVVPNGTATESFAAALTQ